MNEGVFSSWKGQRAWYSFPLRVSGTRRSMTSTMSTRASSESMNVDGILPAMIRFYCNGPVPEPSFTGLQISMIDQRALTSKPGVMLPAPMARRTLPA